MHRAILTDDRFATIVSAIEGGRRVYANVRKFIFYIFVHATPEVLPFLVFALSGGLVPLGLTRSISGRRRCLPLHWAGRLRSRASCSNRRDGDRAV